MTSPRYRRLVHVVAVVLLAWMTADLVGHGLGAHDPGRVGTPAQQSLLAGNGPEAARTSDAPHDCYCCFHLADVRTPFLLQLTREAAWRIVGDTDEHPRSSPQTLYHPPLA